MTVRELLARIDSRELREWMYFYELHPFGEELADLRAGIIASTVANCMTVDGGFKPSDFIPKHGRAAEPDMSDDELHLAGMKFVAALGGTIGKQ